MRPKDLDRVQPIPLSPPFSHRANLASYLEILPYFVVATPQVPSLRYPELACIANKTSVSSLGGLFAPKPLQDSNPSEGSQIECTLLSPRWRSRSKTAVANARTTPTLRLLRRERDFVQTRKNWRHLTTNWRPTGLERYAQRKSKIFVFIL